MRVKSQEIKQLNITAIFQEIDHTSITAEKLRKIFELSEKEEKNSPFLELSPNIKILGMPNRQKDIIVEAKRLKVNDNSGKESSESDLIKYFEIAFNNLIDKNKLTAYGFNYDILITSREKIDFKKFIGRDLLKTLSGISIIETGIRLILSKKGKRYDLQISPTGDPYKILFHSNAHFSLKKINFSQLQKQFNENYLELLEIIKKI